MVAVLNFENFFLKKKEKKKFDFVKASCQIECGTESREADNKGLRYTLLIYTWLVFR